MVNLTSFPTGSKSREERLEEYLIGIEFAGHPKDQDDKANFIVNVDYCLANTSADRVAAALRNLILRTPESYGFVQKTVAAMEQGSNIKTGGFKPAEIATLKRATGIDAIDPKLGVLKADSTLPERIANPSQEILERAQEAKAVLLKIDGIVDAYKKEYTQAPTIAPQPA